MPIVITKLSQLSPAQRRFLADFAREGQALAPCGYAGANRAASAFYRTGESLKRLGLTSRRYPSQAYCLTWRGLAFAVDALHEAGER